MAAGYDGSIKIDTSLDSKGFNLGIKQLSSSVLSALLGISRGLVGITAVSTKVIGIIGTIGKAIGAIGVALVAAFVLGAHFINSMLNVMSTTSEYRNQIKELSIAFADVKGAVYAAFSPLISFALPYIKLIVGWLVNMLNVISMVVAAMLGQKTVMQYVAGSAESAATSTGKLATNTDKAKKAAKGALAAFDQINVLQRNTEETQGAGTGTGAGGAMQFIQVPVASSIEEKIKPIRELFMNLWAGISSGASAAWQFIMSIWNPFATWMWENVINPTWLGFQMLWSTIVVSAKQMWDGGLKGIFDFLVEYIKIGLRMITNIFQDQFLMINGVMGGFMTFLKGLIQFITGVFTGNWKLAWEGITNMFKGIWVAMVSYGTGQMNIIIEIINAMIEGITLGINRFTAWLNTVHVNLPSILGSQPVTIGFNLSPIKSFKIPKIAYPKLATGAVIPPNAAFAAILGDQTKGRNIEAPEDLIRQIIREEMGSNNGDFTVTMPVYLDSEKIYEGQKRVSRRVGKSLVSGVV